MSKVTIFYRKLHRWPGLIISFILLYYGITGVFMNHRQVFSGIDIRRDAMPRNYEYQNWNNAALKGNLIISEDSVLVFGNIGIWLTDSSFTHYTSFNSGLPPGSDNRRIADVLRDKHGELYAATLFGLYGYDRSAMQWKKFEVQAENERFTGIECIGDTLYVINRSYLFKGKSEGIHTQFEQIEIPAPDGYVRDISLFATIWQIHSGEILGLPGRLFVDLLGIVTIFLSLTGIIYFFFPGWLKRRLKKEKPISKIALINGWSLRWHNKIGAWTFWLLIILFFTGMFLRPPLLIAIANARVSPLKYSHLDQPNPWYDKLRDILYDPERGILLLSTSEGMYFSGLTDLQPIRVRNQPPVSVMGINTFQPFDGGAFLIGSFSGLFLWHPDYSDVYNYVTGELYHEQTSGRPVGDYKITGTITMPGGGLYMADYDKGLMPLTASSSFPAMPSTIREQSGMSLWNVCLEIHTGRFFQNLLGDFYILIVPLAGVAGITVVLSGYLLWRKRYRKKRGEVGK
jgi:hypothetical protein